ncbi:hypothetical protein HPB48_022465 [Haemaphysalis longicornis]|uniref:Uncharacterized protein n=1 Tax=Haemaphysalis longicornis TaxID=44386 RepID=A0A9J6FNQ2_HAELO|nr:hypothetical protein HPB48_022465 [Haemaphysalis longicornis]
MSQLENVGAVVKVSCSSRCQWYAELRTRSGRLQHALRSLASTYAADNTAYYVDAAKDRARPNYYTAVVIAASDGTIRTAGSFKATDSHHAEELAIALDVERYSATQEQRSSALRTTQQAPVRPASSTGRAKPANTRALSLGILHTWDRSPRRGGSVTGTRRLTAQREDLLTARRTPANTRTAIGTANCEPERANQHHWRRTETS